MTDTALTPIPGHAPWLPGHLGRLDTAYRAAGLGPDAADALLADRRTEAEGWTVAAIGDPARPAGYVAMAVADRAGTPVGRIGEVWTVPGAEALRPAALRLAEQWCAERGAERVQVRLVAPDPLFDGYGVRGQNRLKVLDGPAAPGDGLTARPMTAAEYPAWRAGEEDAYIADILRSGSHTAAEARLKSDADFARLLPEEQGTPGHAFLVLEAGGEAVGTGWLKHGFLPGVTFGYSLEIHPEHRGRGYGRAAMAAGERTTVAAGDRALMFNVFGGNEVAMGLYTGTGYRVLEENRSRDITS